MPPTIYVLRDPRCGRVRYIGKANNLADRLRRHEAESVGGAAQYYKARWLRELMSSGWRAIIAPLFVVPDGMRWQHAETFFIASARALGIPLTNVTPGGEGLTAVDRDTQARRLATFRVTVSTPEYRAKQSATMRAKFTEPGYREKASASQRRKWANPETRAKMLAKKADPEWRQSQAARQRQIWADPAYRENAIAASRSPERRARASEAARVAHARMRAAKGAQS